MATHSSILAWRIPWTEEPGGLQSMGWQRVRHDWATNTFTTTFSQGIQKLLPTLVLKYTAYLKITNSQSALVSIIIFVSFPKDRFDSDGISIRNNKFFPSPVSEKKKKKHIHRHQFCRRTFLYLDAQQWARLCLTLVRPNPIPTAISSLTSWEPSPSF